MLTFQFYNYSYHMSYRVTVLLLITFSVLTGCRRGYTIEDGKVYYEYWNEGSGQNKRLIKGADARTFEILKFDCDCSFEFGKDKSRVYIDGKSIDNIDPGSFRFIDDYVFRDKDSAYFFGFYNDINKCVMKGVDPDKLELISYPWAKAGNTLIHGHDTLSLDDIDDFQPIDEDWGRTKKYVINNDEILKGADPKTFRVINSYSGRDRKHIYEFGEIKD